MEISRVYLLLKIFFFFIALLIAEYVACGIYFRWVRDSDFLRMDSICGLAATGLCYLVFKKLIKLVLKEKVPVLLVAAVFLFFCLLSGLLLRFSLQLANGWLDDSEPDSQVVVVVDKKTSPFGGSFKEGPNPLAHLVYFQDWEKDGGN